MSDNVDRQALTSDEAVTALLRKAPPRPPPPDADARAIRRVVESEWRTAVGRRRRRKMTLGLAMAASVLVAAMLSLNLLRSSGIEIKQVAAIEASNGSLFVLGEDSELVAGDGLLAVHAGQTLVTGDSSSATLAWGAGGSLRMDASTRVEFLSVEEIRLSRGRLYFDSAPAFHEQPSRSSDAPITIRTAIGSVTHIGTQYMVSQSRTGMTVSVREGEVQIESSDVSSIVMEGQQLAISGRGARQFANVGRSGGDWAWIEATSPTVDLNGRSVSDLLDWAGRESGLTIVFESDTAEAYARSTTLNGTLESPPREALEFWMLGTDLDWRIEEGVIYVNETP